MHVTAWDENLEQVQSVLTNSDGGYTLPLLPPLVCFDATAGTCGLFITRAGGPLAIHELVDAIPARLHVAIPRGGRPPQVGAAARWHVFDSATFDVGRESTAISGADRHIGLYSAERSIVDTFRLRGLQGYEVGVEALRTWLRGRGSNPASLLRMADELPRASGLLRQALSYLG